MNRLYIIYDERAMMMDTSEATILDTASTLEEAQDAARSLGYPCVIYSYRDNGKVADDEQFEEYVNGEDI